MMCLRRLACERNEQQSEQRRCGRTLRCFRPVFVEKRGNFLKELRHPRIVLKRQMVPSRQRNKLGTGNICCQLPTLFDRDHDITTNVKDKRRHRYLL